MKRRRLLAGSFAATVAAAAVAFAGCGGSDADLVVYSGRSEPLIKPFLEEFAEQEGLDVQVRYGETSGLIGTLLEEGENTPADVFIGQDAAALAQLDDEGLLQPYDGIERTPERYRAADLTWTGLSGRARVLAVRPGEDAPQSIFDLTDPQFEGELVAPIVSNVSFRDWVSAIRLVRGDEFTRQYLEGLEENDVELLASNFDAAAAVGRGEFDVGLVNHYYIELVKEEGDDLDAVYTDQQPSGFGVVFNVASAGITAPSEHEEAAQALMDYLLTDDVQERFAAANYEYPVLPGVEAPPGVKPLDEVVTTKVSLEDLGPAAEETDRLLDEVGLGE
ncbi:MAG: extracellular solute-binding protein [Thermoleophilaceae bacterium]|nr:extracellular solute-binding protein [Thermoleophilaceae bacterium]